MSGSTKPPTTSQPTQKKRSHQRSTTQEMGFLKDKNGDPVTISIFDIFTTSKSSKDGAKGRKMSLSKDKVSSEKNLHMGIYPIIYAKTIVGWPFTDVSLGKGPSLCCRRLYQGRSIRSTQSHRRCKHPRRSYQIHRHRRCGSQSHESRRKDLEGD